MLKCAIIGFGGLGKGHMSRAIKMDNVDLVAICDIDREQFNKVTSTNLGEGEKIDISTYNLYTSAEELFEKEMLDFVIIAVPTFLHEKYAIMALNKGIHVFCEKPMARSLEGCANMIDAAKQNNKLLFIGQCLRFEPGYRFIKEAYDTKKYGKLLRIELNRYGYAPIWAWENWYMDFERSGGAALDLHVHDVDMINYILGCPDAVQSDAIHKTSGFDCISTRYIYENGPIVRATGDWSLPANYGFNPDYFVVFEDAVITKGPKGPKVYPINGEIVEMDFSDQNCYWNELEYFVKCIKENRLNDIVPPESTKQTIEIVMAEMESAKIGKEIKL